MAVQEPSQTSRPVEDEDELLYEAAKRRAEGLQGFYIHLIVYAVVNVGLFGINVLTHSHGGGWWFYWPLAAWGVGLLIHAVTFLGVFSPEWSERKARAYVERAKRP